MKLSLCTIALNEAELIGAMLDSVRRVVDEIIVGIDDRTTDDTARIVKQHGGIAMLFTWQDDFAAARNSTQLTVQGEWVLVLDADERLTPAGRAIVLDLMSKARVRSGPIHDYDGFTFPSAQMNGSTCMGIVQTSARLFRNDPSLSYRGLVHEEVWKDSGEASWCAIQGPPVIEHLGYAPKIWRERRKHERNLRLLEMRVAADPTDAYARAKLEQEQRLYENGYERV